MKWDDHRSWVLGSLAALFIAFGAAIFSVIYAPYHAETHHIAEWGAIGLMLRTPISLCIESAIVALLVGWVWRFLRRAARNQTEAQSPISPKEKVSQMTKIVQNNSGGVNIGGDNNGSATVNNYGPIPIVFSGDQLSATYQAARAFGGSRIQLAWEYSLDSENAAKSMKGALEAAGLSVDTMSAMNLVVPWPGRMESGVVFTTGEATRPLCDAIRGALVLSGFPTDDRNFRAILLDWADCVTVYIGKTINR